MKLYFQNCKKEEFLIGEPETVEECKQIIEAFLTDCGLNELRTYRRVVEMSRIGRLMIDFGSYVEFFFIEGISFQEYTKR